MRSARRWRRRTGRSHPEKLLTWPTRTLVSTVGGASGPLWGTAFRRAGRALGDAEEFDGLDLLAALRAALDGVVELGAAQPGDKTMVDALGPAIDALAASIEAGEPLEAGLAAASAAAEEGARATMPCRPGRAVPRTSASARSATRTRAPRRQRSSWRASAGGRAGELMASGSCAALPSPGLAAGHARVLSPPPEHPRASPSPTRSSRPRPSWHELPSRKPPPSSSGSRQGCVAADAARRRRSSTPAP